MRIPGTRTDAYKLSMAEAGAALRPEIFYYTHRRGGWHYMPVDVKEFISKLLPTPTEEEYSYLHQHHYEVGAAYRKSWESPNLTIKAIPKGCWFYDREPAFSIKGPSAVVSWLEPTALMLQYRIQLATLIRKFKGRFHECPILREPIHVTCQEEGWIVEETFEETGCPPPKYEIRSEEYANSVYLRAKNLVEILGDPSRAFEVGMRAVSCVEQHEIALAAIKRAGILRTSNVEAAQKLEMIPVGTMGHEHVQRAGNDYAAFTGMRDRFPGFLSYLTDTFSTLQSGIPMGLRAIAECPDRKAGLRFDSETGVLEQYLFAVAKSREMGLTPYLTLESGWNCEKTVEFEKYRDLVKWPEHLQGYGYGSYLVSPSWETCNRDTVSAVYKLSQTGSRACMKFGDEPGSAKQSIPGDPVIWRPLPLNDRGSVVSVIAQEGETFEGQDKLYRMDGCDINLAPWGVPNTQASPRTLISPQTQALIDQCKSRREESLREAVSCY